MTAYLSPSDWKSLSAEKRRECISFLYYLKDYADSDEYWDDQLHYSEVASKKLDEARARKKAKKTKKK